MSFITTGIRELGLKIRRQRTRMALRHERRALQKSEIGLGREGVSQAVNFPEVRNEIVALKKLEQEQKEVAVRIAQIEEAIKQIETQRQENARVEAAELAKLEEAKRPLVELRDAARAAAGVCERELAAVDARLQENDAADRDLLKQMTLLQAQVPTPSDLETQLEQLGHRRARLPDQRAELVRARLGSQDALRAAREKLGEAEANVVGAEKQIERVRSEAQARDRSLDESSRAQKEEVRTAREHHQVVEERKNPAYLNIGRHLASQGIAPPNAPHLLAHVQKHRTAVDLHLQHKAELAVHSSKIDKQELRKFYFTIVSVLVLLAIIVPLVFQSPASREWLPQETEAILSLNTEQIDRDDLPKKWRREEGDGWPNVWSGLLGAAARTPSLNLARDARRVTRAITTEAGLRDFSLVESRHDVSPAINAIDKDHTFSKSPVSGLPVWQRPDLAVARVGPNTLAVGALAEVDELVQVRLGMKADLKITGQFFDRFQALDRESALRLISRNPPELARIFQPVFAPELLEATQLLGLALTLQNPLKARLLLKTRSPDKAVQLAASLRNEPQRWLRLEGSSLLLFAKPPEIEQQGADLEVRFEMAENSARLLLQRLAKSDPTAPVVTKL